MQEKRSDTMNTQKQTNDIRFTNQRKEILPGFKCSKCGTEYEDFDPSQHDMGPIIVYMQHPAIGLTLDIPPYATIRGNAGKYLVCMDCLHDIYVFGGADFIMEGE